MQKYINNVAVKNGARVLTPLVGGLVTVTTIAGAAATLYDANGGLPRATPLLTDINGAFSFYAADGRYTITITGAGIVPITISDVLLEDPVDGAFVIVDGAIVEAKIGAGAVTTTKIIDGAVTVAKLADNAVTTAKLVDSSVNSPKLASDAVTTPKIVDAAVTAAKLASDSVTDQKVSPALWSTLNRVVSSIAALKALSKNRHTRVFVSGYFASGDGGGGPYYLDAADTTSADNGGTVIVAADGGRWKLAYSRRVFVEQFGAVGTGDVTAAMQAAINFGISGGVQVECAGSAYAITSLEFTDPVYNFTFHSNNAIFNGIATTAKEGLFRITNAVDAHFTGSFHLNCAGSTLYASGVRIRAVVGTSQSTTRLTLHNFTVRSALAALWVGTDAIDYQCSEISIINMNAFGCPTFLRSEGSQTGGSLVGCHCVSEANASFPGVTLRTFLLLGSFWYVNGGSMVQTSTAVGSTLIEARPTTSVTFSNPYGILKANGAHIESAGILLYINNLSALASPRSSISSFSFSDSGGYISSTGSATVVDATADNTYVGKIHFGPGCDFYGDNGVTRASAHIYSGTLTRIDIDGAPFGQSFKQGLSGIANSFKGRVRLRGETLIARSGATTSIASGVFTVVDFPTTTVTNDTAFGDSCYAAGSFTAPFDMKDVIVEFQVAFAAAAANADVCVFVAGANLGYYATKALDTIRSGSVTIPFLASGAAISVRAVTNTGAAIALSGGGANFLRIRASAA